MFYENENENEKDILGDLDNNTDIQISEDGIVSWSDAFEDTTESSASGDVLMGDNDTLSAESDDEIQLMESDDEPDEEELRRILSEGDNDSSEGLEEEKTENTDTKEEDFDFDENLLSANPNTPEDIPEEEITPRKSPQKSNSTLPILIALLVAIVAVGGGFWIYTFLQENNASSGDLQVNNQIKDITPEEMENRANTQEDIPVVNDDTKEAIQPQAQPQELIPEEKKETVDIKTGGRANPFLPVSKYLSVNIPDSYINFENPSIPKPPENYGPKKNKALSMLTISVSGIMYDDVKPSAIITYDKDDYFVQRGDKLDEYRVIDIGKNYVLIALGRNTYKANVGEEFKITDDFYGSAKYLPTGRQYHIVKKNNGSNDSNDGEYNEGAVEVNVD